MQMAILESNQGNQVTNNVDGGNQKLRVRFFSTSKIGFLNAKESEVHSSVPLTHHDPRDLGLICDFPSLCFDVPNVSNFTSGEDSSLAKNRLL